MELNETVWDDTVVKALNKAALWACLGLSGTQRRDLQNRWLPAHFLSSPKKNTNVERLVLHCEWQER